MHVIFFVALVIVVYVINAAFVSCLWTSAVQFQSSLQYSDSRTAVSHPEAIPDHPGVL